MLFLAHIAIFVLSSNHFIEAKPTFGANRDYKQAESFEEVLGQVSKDTLIAAKSKAAVLHFIGSSAINAGIEGVDIGIDFAKTIDLDERLNATEQAILDAKLSKIESKF